jgi:hypothetical protein
MAAMTRRRGLAGVLAVCALAVIGVIAGLLITKDGHETTARTTGVWAPITVKRPSVPVIGGGIPVDVDPLIERRDFSTTLAPLPGVHHYRITISNNSSLGVINSFQWYPPTGVRFVKVVDATQGHCAIRSVTGFGGNQFPTVVLHSNVVCDKLDLKPPSCTCRGDGGAMTISFVTDKDVAGGDVDLRVRAATLVFHRIPAY